MNSKKQIVANANKASIYQPAKLVAVSIMFSNGNTRRANFRNIRDAIQWLNLNDFRDSKS